MKKKQLLFALLGVLSISLTSCDFIYRFFDDGEDGGFSWGIPIGQPSSSKQPIVDVSTPPAGDTNANRASYNLSLIHI